MQIISFMLFSFSLMAEVKGRIICRYYHLDPKIRKSHRFQASLPWIYARDSHKKNLEATGFLEDGFFIPTEIYTADHRKEKKIYENTLPALRTACEEALQQAFPKDYQERSLLGISFKKPHPLAKKIPIVFATQSMVKPKIDRAVLFGDSLSDQGRIKKILRIYPPEPYFSGRFSDGPVWSDYFVKFSGISMQNWAIGGSVSYKFLDFTYDQKNKFMNALNINAGYKICGSLKREVNRYKKKALKNGIVNNASSTLFIIWIGGNDYLNPLNSRLDTDIFIDEPNNPRIGSNVVMKNVINNITRNMERLYHAGARNFMVVNLADMGVMPKVSRITHFHENRLETVDEKIIGLSKALTNITKQHNFLLAKAVKEFGKTHKGTTITEVDTFKTFSPMLSPDVETKEGSFMKKALEPDFVKTVKANGQSVTINKACYYGGIWPSRSAKRCKDPSRLWFWDEVHPSSFTHCLFAYFIQRELSYTQMASRPLLVEYLRACKPEIAHMSLI